VGYSFAFDEMIVRDSVGQEPVEMPWSLAYSPDGRTLASGASRYWMDDARIRLWDVGSGRNTATLPGHTGAILSLAFDGGGTLLSLSQDGTARLWDVARGETTATLQGGGGGIGAVAFGPAGRAVAMET